MPNAQPPDPRLARLRPTDEELAREAEITEADVLNAIVAFNRHCPPDARGMMDAKVEQEEGKGE